MGRWLTSHLGKSLSLLLFLAAVQSSAAQSPLAPPTGEVAKSLYSVYGACRVYWGIAKKCAPSVLDRTELPKILVALDKLDQIGATHMEWLAARAGISSALQGLIVDRARDRVLATHGERCETIDELVSEFDERCKNLAKNIATVRVLPVE